MNTGIAYLYKPLGTCLPSNMASHPRR